MKITLIRLTVFLVACVAVLWMLSIHTSRTPKQNSPPLVLHTGQQSGSGPSIAAQIPSPAVIDVNTKTAVVFTATISGSSYIPGSANVLRLDSSNKVIGILGQLHDDGLNGDAIAGDGTYSAVISFNEAQTGSFRLEATAAFRGMLRRLTSNVVDVTLVPPDPGEAGNSTVAGIDSDNDGVRDDIQRYIAFTYPNSERSRTAVMQLARDAQSLLVNSGNPNMSVTKEIGMFHSQECLYYIEGVRAASSDARKLDTVLLNTSARSDAWLQADDNFAGQIYTLTPPDQRKSQCLFNPDLMPN